MRFRFNIPSVWTGYCPKDPARSLLEMFCSFHGLCLENTCFKYKKFLFFSFKSLFLFFCQTSDVIICLVGSQSELRAFFHVRDRGIFFVNILVVQFSQYLICKGWIMWIGKIHKFLVYRKHVRCRFLFLFCINVWLEFLIPEILSWGHAVRFWENKLLNLPVPRPSQ